MWQQTLHASLNNLNRSFKFLGKLHSVQPYKVNKYHEWLYFLLVIISYRYVTAVSYVVSVVGQLTERISEDKEGGGTREKDTEQKGMGKMRREKNENI